MPRIPHVPHGRESTRPLLAFRRDPAGPFDDARKDEFAKARAKGGSIRASSTVAGIDYQTGIKWEKHPEMVSRIRELRGGAETFIGVTTAWVIAELAKNVQLARDQNAIKASNEALGLIHKFITEDKDTALKMVRTLPHTVGGKQLQKAVMEAFNGPPEALPERNVNLLETDAGDDEEAAE